MEIFLKNGKFLISEKNVHVFAGVSKYTPLILFNTTNKKFYGLFYAIGPVQIMKPFEKRDMKYAGLPTMFDKFDYYIPIHKSRTIQFIKKNPLFDASLLHSSGRPVMGLWSHWWHIFNIFDQTMKFIQ